MKFTPKAILLSLALSLFAEFTVGQCTTPPPINFVNPSFEGTPGSPGITPSPWTECMLLPDGSPQTPDTQPGSWGVSLPPANGVSYIGLVEEASAGWQEGAAEQLAIPLVAGTSYTFTIDVANSSATGGGIVPGCAECQIWGGFSACDTGSLLWHSGNITPYDVWQLDTVRFVPTQNFTWLMIRINSLGCSSQPYILVDNLGEIVASNVTLNEHLVSEDRCAGDSTGKAVVDAVGQNPPFTYHWSTPLVSADSILNNVPAGTYTVTVTDSHSCTATTSITITQPQQLSLTPDVIQPSCGGANTGSAYMSYAGGTTPVSFIWSNGPTTQSDPGLFDGTYNITATDANGCTVHSSISIAEPTTMIITATITNATCNQSTGSIAASVTGGATPYTFAWNTTPAQTTATATGLAAATYIVTVTDNNHCTASASFSVSQPPSGMTATVAVTNVKCNGQSTGAISTTASGGSPPYSYDWSNTSTTSSISSLAAGVYSVTINDQSGCGYVIDTSITQPTALAVSVNATNISCPAPSTGNIVAMVTGGTTAYSYAWNSTPPQTTATATNLGAGNYTITVTDANLCSVSASATITAPGAVTLTESHVDVLCFGDSTGSATVIPVGGTTYTYLWNTTPPQTTGTISSLKAGSYTITVTDNSNCTATITSVVTQPVSPVSVTATVSAPLCFGGAAASAKATATGGTVIGGGYTYSWSTTPVQTTDSATNLAGGNYRVIVTDVNGCTAAGFVTVAPPPTALTVTTAPVEVLCFGGNTGSIAATATGSYGSYTYAWNTVPAQTTATAAQLTAGNYSVTVTDLNGCTGTATDVVTQPATPLAATATGTNVLCNGGTTGAAVVLATGGTTAYSYAWNTIPQQTTAAVATLSAGNYMVTVTDANACTATATVTITQPTALQATSTITNISCNGQTDGSIDITTSGGAGTYTYQWTGTAVTTADATNLAASTYAVTVTDANSCTTALTNLVVTQPAAIGITTAPTNVSCPGHGDGEIATTLTGGTSPYIYNWSNGETTANDLALSGGTYSVTATDSKGCTVAATNILITELPGVQFTANVTNILCFPLQDGAIDINASSSFMPLKYQWSNGAVTPNLANTDTGTYSVTVTDAHNCTVDTTLHVGNDSIYSISINPDTATIKLGESINIEVTPYGSSFGSIIWTPSEGLSCGDCANPDAAPVQTITYYVATTDVNGCTANTSTTITVIPAYTVFIPNAFTPNSNNAANDYFQVFGNKEAWKFFSISIFDRWGEKVLETNDMDFKWDGQFKGKEAPMGVYVYEMRVVFLDNHVDKLFKGSVTLIR